MIELKLKSIIIGIKRCGLAFASNTFVAYWIRHPPRQAKIAGSSAVVGRSTELAASCSIFNYFIEHH